MAILPVGFRQIQIGQQLVHYVQFYQKHQRYLKNLQGCLEQSIQCFDSGRRYTILTDEKIKPIAKT